MFLIGMDVPLAQWALFYLLCLYRYGRTSLNVWSDLSVTAIVGKECTHLEALPVKNKDNMKLLLSKPEDFVQGCASH